MTKPGQPNTDTKEAAKGQPDKEVKGAAGQATTATGLAGLNDATLADIVQNRSARPATRIAAVREIHGRSGGQYSGLERLDIDVLAKIAEDKAMPEDLRTAAADALALPRTAKK